MNYTASSHAKVNLALRVLGSREDGYHNIYTLFCGIGLHDTLEIVSDNRTYIICNDENIPTGQENIIFKVDHILRQSYNLEDNYRINLIKRIPAGAGLGGGSSNACCYLTLVNEASNLNLSREAMTAILAAVGSDAPFFLYLPLAVGEGRGEILTPVESKVKLYFILINPRIFISTASVYKDEKLELTSPSDIHKIPTLFRVEDVTAIMANDLETPVFARYPELETLCREMEKAGAVKAMLSGSGSTVFGVFGSQLERDEAFCKLSEIYRSFLVVKTESL